MRLYNWESRYAAYVTRVAREGFAWGRHDCALFAAGGVEAVTGEDPAALWRGRYASLAEGLRLIREAGFEDHIDAAACAFPAIARDQVLPADLAVVAQDDPALGLVQGGLIYVLTPGGLGLVPIEAARSFLGVR